MGIAPTPAGAVTSVTATCVDGGVTWRVTYDLDPSFGGIAHVTGLHRIQGGSTFDEAGSTWQVRWDKGAAQWPAPPPPPPGGSDFNQVQGPLSSFSGQSLVMVTSPRLVVPTGACTVYLAPYYNLHELSGPSVGVLGDELTAHLNDATVNQTWPQGHVERDVNELAVRAEVEGHAGARMVDVDGTTGLVRANGSLLDEFRGLTQRDTDGFVVALGANDAAYVAAGGAAGSPGWIARRDEVAGKQLTFFGDLTTGSDCVVTVTTPEDAGGAYGAAAVEINNLTRFLANTVGDDAFIQVDFATQAKTHLAGSSVPWFTADNIHLTAAGQKAYSDAITLAASRCTRSAPARSVEGKAFDPWSLISHNGNWYLTHNNAALEFAIRVAPSVALLDDAPVQTIKGPSGGPFTRADLPADVSVGGGGGGHLLHWNAKWYWFTGNGEKNYVLESSGDDPLGPYQWKATFPSPSVADGGNATAYQPSPFVVDGQLYLVSSSPHNLPQWGTLPLPRMFITKLDNPWDTTVDWELLNDPTTCWEGEKTACPGGAANGRPVAEGASVLVRGQTVYLIYSANDWAKKQYAVGMLTADLADAAALNDPSVWTKHDGPVLASNEPSGPWGPGSIAFVTSPDGTEDWLVYHVKSAAADGDNRVLQIKQLESSAPAPPDFGVPRPVESHSPLPAGDPGGGFLEAEHGDLTQVSVLRGGTSSGHMYVSGITTGSSVKLWANVPVAGTYPVRIWYANTASGIATQQLAVNSGPANLTVPYHAATATPGVFPMERYTTVSATLQAGWNSLTFTPGTGSVQLDRVQVDVDRTANGVASAAPSGTTTDIFALNASGQVRSRSASGSTWSAWATPPGQPVAGFAGVPATTARGGGVDLVAVGKDGNLWSASRSPAGVWQAWADAGRPSVGIAPVGATVVSLASDSFDVFVLGGDRDIWRRRWTAGTGWSAWSKPVAAPNAKFVSAPAAVVRTAGQIDLYAVAGNGLVYSTFGDGTTWNAWSNKLAPNGRPLTSAVTVTSSGSTNLQLFVRAANGEVWTRVWGGVTWGDWTQVSPAGAPGSLSSSIGVSSRPGTNSTDIFTRFGTTVYTSTRTGTGPWSSWTSLGVP